LATEAQLLRWAEHGFDAVVPCADPAVISNALLSHPELSDEQIEMVTAVCRAREAIQVIEGRPGSGKTLATAACVDAFCSSGVPVVGCALSAVAAAELENATQLRDRTGRPATTFAKLLYRLDAGQALEPETVVLVDEASMVGTRDMARLAHHVAQVGGAIKLIGDPDQHGPVEAGGLFRKLVRDGGASVISLVENQRQIDPAERAAIEEYRDGRISAALARYDQAGRLIRSRSARDSYDRIVADWYEAWSAGSRDPMMAGTHRTRRALNAHARARLTQEGQLLGEPLEVEGRMFEVGDWVVTRHNDYRLRNRVEGEFVKNGSVGTIVKINHKRHELVVDFAKEGSISLPHDYVDAGWVEHAYARTTYGVEGATLTSGFYHAGGGPG
jgi:ATP-dependent exoDNAse (exonuclease V) alpha subunit